jgi:hypothetical protein
MCKLISEVERYKFVVSQVEYLNEKIIETFSLYVKLLTGVIGGAVWLRLQRTGDDLWFRSRPLVVVLVVLIDVMASALIIFNLHAWWGFRKAESDLTGGQAVMPRFPRSCRQEISMLLVIVVSVWVL